jgi:subtilisin family serine protease
MNFIKSFLTALIVLTILFVPATVLGAQYTGRDILTATWQGEPVEYVDGEILFMVKNGDDPAGARSFLTRNKLNLTRELDSFGFGKVSLPEGQNVFPVMEAMQATGLFLYVEPNMIDHACLWPNDPEFTGWKQWGLHNIGQNPPNGTFDADIDAPEAWDSTTGSSSVIVSVLDSGIPMVSGSLSHPDLDKPSKMILGIDLVGDGEGVRDKNGHGTHVAGIISAETNNGVGVAGVSWDSRIMVIQVFNSSGSGSHEAFRDGMIYSTDNGAHVVNYSGGGSPSSTKIHGVAYADSHDVLLAAAAGNNYGGSVIYPAAYATTYQNVICVSSTGHTDHVSSFSSIGSQVSVAAPGGFGAAFDANDIYSTMPNYYVSLNGSGISQNYGYCYGTSMASPMVAGAAALILSANSSLLPSEVRGILEETADQVGGYYYDPGTGKSTQLGHGRINAYAAVVLATQDAYVAGDANGDDLVDVADIVFLINYLYRSGMAPDPLAAGDPSADCVVDVADIVYLINYLYRGGPAPQPGCA